MVDFSAELLGLRIFISVIGTTGNVVLMVSILRARCGHLKSFEVFLLGLAASNVEGILVVDIYDVFIFQMPMGFRRGVCQSLKFLSALGETASILFTVLICVFRYQKLRDAETRVNLPIFLDGVRVAWATSGLCVALAVLLSAPAYLMNLDNHLNETAGGAGSACPPDFFECHKRDCPFANRFYKYLFIVVVNMLPLAIVTATSCLIVRVLLGQRRGGGRAAVAPTTAGEGAAGRSGPPGGGKGKRSGLQRSTVAVLAAMGVFQVDWTLYLILHLAVSPYDFPFWSEINFFISTSYTTISPYVYGIGNNIFSFQTCKRICPFKH